MGEKHKSGESNIIWTEKEKEFEPQPGGIGKLYFHTMRSHGKAPAQIDGLTGEVDTYESLLNRCIRAAIKMRSKGVKADDIITICSPAHLNRCVPYFAGLFLGAAAACFDPTLPLSDLTHLLTLVHPKIIFVHSDLVSLFETALKETNSKAELVVFGESDRHLQFSEFLQESPEENDFLPTEVEDLKKTVFIFFSSGTTGKIKPIAVNHFSFMSKNVRPGQMDHVLLFYFSMYWIVWAVWACHSIVKRGCIVVVPKFEPDQVWDLVQKFKVTVLPLPTNFARQIYDKIPENADLSFLKAFVIGSTFAEESLIVGFRKKLPKTIVMVFYGQSEAAGTVTGFTLHKEEDLKLMMKKPNSTGRPIPGLSYKVVDPDTEEILGPNREGELRIKSEFTMSGYHNLDSADAWDSDGWLKTGDIVYYDEDQCFFIVDRLKEIIRVHGFHVSPTAIENMLLTHPAVEAAVVVGLPDKIVWENPCGVVVLKEEFKGKVTAEEIQRYVDERVDERKKLTGGVRIVEKIPITTTGKKKRLAIRDLIVRGDI